MHFITNGIKSEQLEQKQFLPIQHLQAMQQICISPKSGDEETIKILYLLIIKFTTFATCMKS